LPTKKRSETSAFKTADTVTTRKRQRQIDAVNTAPRAQRKAVVRKILKSNQGKRK
jgi:hypothetical protein